MLTPVINEVITKSIGIAYPFLGIMITLVSSLIFANAFLRDCSLTSWMISSIAAIIYYIFNVFFLDSICLHIALYLTSISIQTPQFIACMSLALHALIAGFFDFITFIAIKH